MPRTQRRTRKSAKRKSRPSAPRPSKKRVVMIDPAGVTEDGARKEMFFYLDLS